MIKKISYGYNLTAINNTPTLTEYTLLNFISLLVWTVLFKV